MRGFASFTFVAGVLMGTITAVVSKVLYTTTAIGSSGHEQYFEKPLLLTALMFVSMIFALPVHWLNVRRERREMKLTAQAKHELTIPLVPMGEMPEHKGASWRTLLILIVPATFDLMATALGSIGLIFTTVSIYQLIRCSVMIVTAAIKALVLREKLKPHMWWGIAINTVAMMLVSAINFMPDHSDSQPGPYRDPRLGVMFTLLSCVVQASQYVFEEQLMGSEEDAAAPLLVVGMEGVWGAAIMVLIVFPWAGLLPGTDQGGCIENVWDAWVMMQNSETICTLVLVFVLAVLLYNVFCVYITFLLDSIWHAILENFRPCAVWGVDLALYYFFTNGAFGEAWTTWSWMELAGMITLFVGTAVYNGTVPFLDLGASSGDEKDAAAPTDIYTSDSIASSPLIAHNARRRSWSSQTPISNLSAANTTTDCSEEEETNGQNGRHGRNGYAHLLAPSDRASYSSVAIAADHTSEHALLPMRSAKATSNAGSTRLGSNDSSNGGGGGGAPPSKSSRKSNKAANGADTNARSTDTAAANQRQQGTANGGSSKKQQKRKSSLSKTELTSGFGTN